MNTFGPITPVLFIVGLGAVVILGGAVLWHFVEWVMGCQ